MRITASIIVVIVFILLIVIGLVTRFRPQTIGSVLQTGKTEISSQELVDLMNKTHIVSAFTNHNQGFFIVTKYGFKYRGKWNRGIGIMNIVPGVDKSDIMNLISGYDRHYNWGMSLCGE